MAITVRRQKQPQDSFDDLVRNAFDFFDASIKAFSDNPKHSVIHFCAAVELFFKARLLQEHWTLTLEDPRKADRQKFFKGDFKSVVMDEAIGRLKAICGEELSVEDQRVFRSLREHRNRFVHFFHPEESTSKEAIAIELCGAWYAVRQLVGTKWQFLFEKYQLSIEDAERRMMSLKQFLAVKYERLSSRLSEIRSVGRLETCIACGHEASEVFENDHPLIEGHCHVCDARHRTLSFACVVEQCDGDVRATYFLGGFCDQCSKYYGTNDIVGALDTSPGVFFCSQCNDSLPSVITLAPGIRYVCVACLETFKRVVQCSQCDSHVAGLEVEEHGLSGCPRCTRNI